MRRFPLYTQHDMMDCGPTCLRMIAEWHGRKYTLQKLRELCFYTNNGVSLLGISEAAEKIGMHTIGAQLPLERFHDDLPLPCILHWNQEHFVVLYNVRRKRGTWLYYIADPRGSKLRFTEEELAKSWLSSRSEGEDTGVALFLEPTPEFYKQEIQEGDHRQGSFNFLFSYLKPYHRLVIQLILGLLIGSLLQLILPFLTQSIVDFGITNQDIGFIYLILIAQVTLTLSSAEVEFIRGSILLHIGSRINISLISDYLAKLMRLPIAYFDTKQMGDILQRISDHSRIQNFLTNTSLIALFSIFNIVVFGIVIAIYDWRIFTIFFVGSALYVAWVWLFMKRRKTLDNKLFAQHSANQSNLVHLIEGMQEIKLDGCEHQKRWEWERIQASIYRISVKGLALAQYQSSGAIVINQVKNAIITALVATYVVRGEMSLGAMLAIQYIIGQLNGPINQLVEFMKSSQDAKLSLERLQEVYAKDDEVDTHTPLISGIHTSDIIIDHLTFKYDKLEDRPVLDDICLTFPAGKTTAIVGLSGSGKTTLLKMVLGFYQPDKGKVVVGNANLNDYDIHEWRKHCGAVMQEGFIFSDTIARNIAPGVEHIDRKCLAQAAQIACISDFIETLPLGYSTKVGPDGHGLSQGQKQRLLIARAVYKNPDYIFMDEATNSLDANNEKSIMEQLEQFLANRTSIIIAHRLSTVRNADNIVVMRDGKVCEQGRHEELLAQHGLYYSLVKNQLNV